MKITHRYLLDRLETRFGNVCYFVTLFHEDPMNRHTLFQTESLDDALSFLRRLEEGSALLDRKAV